MQIYEQQMDYVSKVIYSILNTFPIVSEIGLSQYLKGIKVISNNSSITKYLKHAQKQYYIALKDIQGVRLVAKTEYTPYDMASINAFDMMAALNEIAGINEFKPPIPVVRCSYPYDYMYSCDDLIFTIINYDINGAQKVIAHNLLKPEAYIGADDDLEQITVITFSDGFAEKDIDSIPVRGKTIFAKIERKPTDLSRFITFSEEEDD